MFHVLAQHSLHYITKYLESRARKLKNREIMNKTRFKIITYFLVYQIKPQQRVKLKFKIQASHILNEARSLWIFAMYYVKVLYY